MPRSSLPARVESRLRAGAVSVGVLAMVAAATLGVQLVGNPVASAAPVPTCAPSSGNNNCVTLSGTGANQTFKVPKGVTSLTATLNGAGGGLSDFDGNAGGAGGLTVGTIAVTSGQVLNVTVGTAGGFGGGGQPGVGQRGTAGTGGGLSALWTGTPLTGTPLLLAGGGGGTSGAGAPHPSGGVGGGADGGVGNSVSGSQFAGGGGSQTAGGTGGQDGGTAGAKYQGGDGSDGADSGGGGGGGWFGGGGGHGQVNEGDDNNDGGGGGGSGFIGGAGVTDATTTAGAGADAGADGSVVLDFAAPAPTVTSPANGSVVADTTPTFAGTGVPGAAVRVIIDDAAITCAEGAPVIVASDGSWSCTATEALASGTQTAIARQSDPAQDAANYPASEPVTFTIDTTPPVVPAAPEITSPADGTVVGADEPNPTVTGSGTAPGDTITITDDGTTICTTTISETQTWTCTPDVELSPGRHTLLVTETNTAGTSDPATLVLIKRPVDDLGVTSTTSRAAVTVGQTAVITVTATNNGPDAETAAQVKDPIGGALGYVSSDASAGEYDSSTGVWTIGALPVGGSETLTLTVKGVKAGSATVAFTISGARYDTVASNNTDSVVIAVTPAASTSPTPTPTPTPTPSPSVSPTATASATASSGGLPNTGYDPVAALGLSGFLLLFGLVIMGVARRRHRH